jgi:isoquinoline 1-oxidoreductase alpha subunit
VRKRRGARRRSHREPSLQLTLRINGTDHTLDVDPSTPLLWVLRDHLGLTGTKFGCGIAQCGACTVHVNGDATRSCQLPVQYAAGSDITTIEGLAAKTVHPLQKLWVDLNVPQCGYCQTGMLMAAAALLAKIPNPSDADIDRSVDNICRCGTYPRVRDAIHKAAEATDI